VGLPVGIGQCRQESFGEGAGGVSLGELGAEGGLDSWDRFRGAPLEYGAEELHVARLHVTGDGDQRNSAAVEQRFQAGDP
jgi:hypothetical protein